MTRSCSDHTARARDVSIGAARRDAALTLASVVVFVAAVAVGCSSSEQPDALAPSPGAGTADSPTTGRPTPTTRSEAESATPIPAANLAHSTLPADRNERNRRLADASLARMIRALNAPEEQALVEQGMRLYRVAGCVQCHAISGEQRIGPNWFGVWADERQRPDGTTLIIDAGFIELALDRPSAYVRVGFPDEMPSFAGELSPRETLALIAFIRSLDEPEPAPLDMLLARTGPTGAEPEPRDPLNIFNEPTRDERRRAEFERIPPAPTPPDQAGVRNDGRPAWWFDGLRREGGRVLLCVETLGDDLVTTRRTAVDRAYNELAQRLQRDTGTASIADPRVELSTVVPLPNPSDKQRYAGYVLISARPTD